LAFRVLTIAAAASALLAVVGSSEGAPQVRDHRHSSSGIQVNAPPNVSKDTSTANRSHGGVGVTPAKNQRVYENKYGQKVFRRCGQAGHPC
jgi:hypothetical protein